MILDFDRGTDPTRPLDVNVAISRGLSLVNRPVLTIMLIQAVIGALVAWVFDHPVVGYSLAFSAPLVAWLWWSYAAPRWRYWALQRGVDAEELQEAAEQANLLWPRGHFFEKTEFPFKGD